MKVTSATTGKVCQRIVSANWRGRMAQISNLLYRRIAFGKALENPKRPESAHTVRIENPRSSRLEICATGPAHFWKVVLLVLLAEGAAILAFYGLEWGVAAADARPVVADDP